LRPTLWRSRIAGMSDVTHILSQIETGDPSAAEQLLPLVY
jgi:ECF sigma factor